MREYVFIMMFLILNSVSSQGVYIAQLYLLEGDSKNWSPIPVSETDLLGK